MVINKTKHRATEDNFHKEKNNKKQIIIGFSLRKKDFNINRFKNRNFGESKDWSTFTISRSGEVYQHYDPLYWSEYVKLDHIDKQSISIELENMGSLIKKNNGSFVNFLNETCEPEFVMQKKWMGYEYWELFPSEQIESLILLCKKLCNEYNIIQNGIPFPFYNNNVDSYKGVLYKSNYFVDSTSINPLFIVSDFNFEFNKK